MQHYGTLALTMLGAGMLAMSTAIAGIQEAYWLSENGDAQIEITPCEDDEGVLCGHIVWLEEPCAEHGGWQLDELNRDSELRDRKVFGLRILWDLQATDSEENRWQDGTIYDPEAGRSYNAIMSLDDDGTTLDIRGYVGRPFLGRTTQWTREAERRELDQECATDG